MGDETSLRNKDKLIIKKYLEKKSWGISTCLDLKECNPRTIRSAEKIKEFVVKLCNLIKMKRFGKTTVVDFGEDPKVSGFSMIQLIETSLISGHFANQTNAAYIDIFSCKEYPPQVAAEFCKDFFEAKSVEVKINFRH